jgi:AAA ATPase domain
MSCGRAGADVRAEVVMSAQPELKPMLLNRQKERAALDGLLRDLRSGRSGALVVRGEAGVGKSALLEWAVGAAADMRVVRAAGVESEMELAGAQASLQAGAFDAAAELLVIAAAGPLGELQQARAALLRGQIAFASTAGSDAPALLIKVAQQLEPLDAALVRQTYLDAWTAALFAGRFAGAGDLHEVARAARSAPQQAAEHAPELFISAWALPDWGRGIYARSRALLSDGRTPRAAIARRSTG